MGQNHALILTQCHIFTLSNPVILYIHLVIVKVEVVSNTEPVSTLLAGETLKMVNIGSGSHHHLKGGNHLKREVYCDLLFNLILFFYLSTSSTVAGRAKESEVVALAQQEVPLCVQRLTNLIFRRFFLLEY